MERWSGRVAVVTGARGGIGGAVARALVDRGLKVVGLDCKPIDTQIADSCQNAPGKLFSLVTDLLKEEEILSAFRWTKENLGGVDILANIAGIGLPNTLHDGLTSEWRDTMDVNVLALSICTREALKSMRERGVDDGHIIHIGSICALRIVDGIHMSIYSASKHAVRALAEGLRKELNELNSRIKITIINPGSVRTVMAAAALLETEFKTVPFLEPEDIADAIIYTLSTPPRVQVHEITIQPNGELF